MYTYHEAKDECRETLQKVKELYNKSCKNIIERDLVNYIKQNVDLQKVKEHYYLLEDNIEIYSGDGLLTIDDKRNIPFRYVFEIDTTTSLRITDTIFVNNQYVNTIEYMNIHEFEDYKNEVEKVIGELKQSLIILSTGVIETAKYTYVCDEPKIQVDSLENVIEYVKSKEWKY